MAKVFWLTGFGPFPGVEANPSAAVARQLHGTQTAGFDVLSEVLPASFERASTRVSEVYQNLRPRAVLHLGVDLNARQIRVQRLAANEQTASIPDADGLLALGLRCSSSYPIAHKLSTCADVDAIAARIRRHAMPAHSSDDAGRYVGNSTYFNALQGALELQPAPLVLLVHLPAIGNPRSVGGLVWQLDDLVVASRAVLIALSDQLTGRTTGPIA